MARNGIYQVTNREIIEAAGQRNTSALSYYFGSRDALLLAIIAVHGPPLDQHRGQLGIGIDAESPTDVLIATLLIPYGGCLFSASGRDYVQIIDQLRGQFGDWRSGPASSETNLQRVLQLIGDRPADSLPEIRHERLIAMMTLMTAMVADRARAIEAGQAPTTGHEQFLSNLVAMLVGVIETPTRLLGVAQEAPQDLAAR